MTTFIIGYDIRSPKRLQRVHRMMLNFAVPIEESVFLLEGTTSDLENCVRRMQGIIHLDHDDFRCYRLPTDRYDLRIGKKVLPEGVYWTGFPH